MDSIGNVASYPTERTDWPKTILIGGILVFAGFLLVPLILVYGYLVRVIRDSLEDSGSPPEFTDWGELLVDGLQGWVIGIIYLLIPGVVAALTVGTAAVTFVVDQNVAAVGGLLFGLLLSAILSVVFGYVAVAALVNFARVGSFTAAFDFTLLRQVLVHRDYAIAWLVALAGFVLAGIVSTVPLVGWLLGPFATFYALTVAGHLWAGGFSAAVDGQGKSELTSTERPAA
ncbi:MAG: DUF4013 domain-containing protein [Halovenus sp.]